MPPTCDAIGLIVSDMAASLAFYRQVGLDVPEGAEAAPHVEVELGGGVRLLIDTEDVVRSFHPGWTRPTGGPRAGLAFRCTDPAEVDATYTALTDAGHQGVLEPWDAVWGQRDAAVADPDGSTVDLYAALADGS